MRGKDIYITKPDMVKLRSLLENSHVLIDCLKRFKGELDRAKVVEPRGILEDVITMNSRVALNNLDTGEEVKYWLVFPERADPSRNMISVLDSLGTAMLGYREGDVLEGGLPSGVSRLEVVEVLYQPERLGNYIL
jgi:regulator of nucleoside diphosphate kinase